MSLGFLRHAHRAELVCKPVKAIHCWQDGYDAGQFLYDQKKWQQALPHIGSAFETAEILITTNAIKPICAHELFKASASLLMDVYARLGARAQCENIYRLATARLRRESHRHPEAQKSIAHYLDQLHKHADEFDGRKRQHDCSRAVLSA